MPASPIFATVEAAKIVPTQEGLQNPAQMADAGGAAAAFEAQREQAAARRR